MSMTGVESLERDNGGYKYLYYESKYNTFAFRSGRIVLIWKDREYSFRFQGFLAISQKM